MNHSNVSQSSLNDNNYYDINLNNQKKLPNSKKKFSSMPPPRRVTSVSSLCTLNEIPDVKRPGDYYINKLSNSSLNLVQKSPIPPPMPNNLNMRPVSGESIISLQSNLLDDYLLANSSQFDPESRLSSLTSNSLTSPLDSPSVNQDSTDDLDLNNLSLDNVNSSLSTINLKSENTPNPRPIKSLSTSNINNANRSPSLPQRSPSIPNLVRTKSKFLNAKEAKQRKLLRKKAYDDSENDDIILSNDLDLVFNVPIIKNNARLFINSNGSKMLSHSDLVTEKSNYHYSLKNSTPSSQPFPLPGLDSSVLDESHNSSFDDSLEITQNITDFYSQSSESLTKAMKSNRKQDLMYKLPNFVKSQSSVDDLNLMSPEKLNFLDQTRPINLPPKKSNDKLKHNKQISRVISNIETNQRHSTEGKKKLVEKLMVNQKLWIKFMTTNYSDLNQFNKKVQYEKFAIRKLNWDSVCPNSVKFDYFSKILSLNLSSETINEIDRLYTQLNSKFQNMTDDLMSIKDNEFDQVIKTTMKRPLYSSILKELDSEFDYEKFEANYRIILYLKFLSPDGLAKIDEIFLIPMFLLQFKDASVSEIFKLVELFNLQIFNREFFNNLNNNLKSWSNDAGSGNSSFVTKFLSKFNDITEFQGLNSINVFEILLQFNDKMPLSLSAPSTPIINQHHSFQSPTSPSSQQLDSPPTTNHSIDENLCDLSSYNSSTFNLMSNFLQLLLIYSSSPKTKVRNFLKIFESLMVVVFKYYHINWNTYGELIRSNKSIKINNSSDSLVNLESFMDKWKDVFRRI